MEEEVLVINDNGVDGNDVSQLDKFVDRMDVEENKKLQLLLAKAVFSIGL